MKSRYRRLLLLMIFVLAPSLVQCVTVTGLYQAEVPVENARAESRPAAVRTALGLVLIKLTGNRFAMASDALQPLIRRAEGYVQEFSYPEEGVLRVRFDETALTADLRDLGIPLWGNERPSTLIWLVTGDGSDREILGLEGDAEILSIINQRAKRRGVVIVYPLLDLTDSLSVRPGDVWGGFMQTIVEASRRYPADSILTGSMETPAPGIWTGRWTAYMGGETQSWDTQGDIPAIVLDEGIDGLADFLSARFIQVDVTDQSLVSVTITNINNIDQYAHALKYLESLSFVTAVQVTEVVNGEVTYSLKAHGGCAALNRAFEIGRRLEPVDGSDCKSYRLLPEP